MRKYLKMSTAIASIGALGLMLSACSTTDTTTYTPTEYQGAATSAGPSIIQQLKAMSSAANPNIVFAVGKCDDETGKFLDQDQLRYSRAVSAAGQAWLVNYAKMAGFKVAERDPYNLGLIANEWKMSHTYPLNVPPGTAPKNIGLIQFGGPSGAGLVGANYLLTCAIDKYESTTTSGGGGLSVDAIGGSVQESTAIVGVTLHITNMSNGLVVSSLGLDTKVVGHSVDFTLTRFIGDVASTVATVSGGTSTATVLAPRSNAHVIQGEVGGAMQMPIDYALNDALVADFARQLEANSFFYTKPVHFTYDGPTGN